MRTPSRRVLFALAAMVATAGVLVAQPWSANAVVVVEDLIVTGAGPGGDSHVQVFDSDGSAVASFYAFPGFHGGVDVALVDLDGDGLPEIVAGAGPGGGPHVRVFDIEGAPIDEWSFFAYSEAFRGGVHLGVADIDGDGDEEIVTSPGAGGGPHVRVYDLDPDADETFVHSEFMAYASNWLGGVYATGLYSDGDSFVQGIVTSAGPGGAPHVRVFTPALAATAISFYAYDPAYAGGVNVAAFDFDGDGIDEIVTGALEGRGHVRSFQQVGAGTPGALSFYAFNPTETSGVDVGSLAGLTGQEALLGATANSGAQAKTFTRNGTTVRSITAYNPWNGGVHVAGGVAIFDDGTAPTTTTTSTSTTSTSTTSTTAPTSTTSSSTTSTTVPATTTTVPATTTTVPATTTTVPATTTTTEPCLLVPPICAVP